jgi:hypothetical protein
MAKTAKTDKTDKTATGYVVEDAFSILTDLIAAVESLQAELAGKKGCIDNSLVCGNLKEAVEKVGDAHRILRRT